MKIIVNGFEEEVESGVNLPRLIEKFEEEDKGLIVELNGAFVYPADYESTIVREGDKIEFIHPAFGG